MAAVTTRLAQQTSDTLLAPTYNAAAAGDKVHPGVLLHIKNASGGSVTMTMVTPGTAFGQAIGDKVNTVGAGTDGFVRVPAEGFADTTGLVPLTWSATTSVTFAVLQA